MHQNHCVQSNDTMNREDAKFFKTVFGMCWQPTVFIEIVNITWHNSPKSLLLLDEEGVNERFGGESPNQ